MPRRFAVTKTHAMFRIYGYICSLLSEVAGGSDSKEDFDRICNLMVEGRIYRKKDFRDASSGFRAGEIVLDNMFYDCVGMSGDDVMIELRDRKPKITM